MSDVLKIILIAVVAYLCGSISSAVLVSKTIFGKDVRTMGSHNAGSTNMARVFSFGAGLLTLACDFIKTFAAMFFGKWLYGETGTLIAGLFCIVGHAWPVFFKFKGGKGIAVAGAISLMLDWRHFLIVLGVFLVSAIISKRVSIGSLCAAITYPIAFWILGEASVLRFVLSALIVIAVYWLHRENIKRIFAGKEPPFKFKIPTPKGKQKSM